MVGGLISVIGQFFSLYYENKKWKKEKVLDILKVKKQDLEDKYKTSTEQLHKSFQTDTYDTDSSFNFIHIYPKDVLASFELFLKDRDENDKLKRQNLLLIFSEMKKSLADIDQKILDEINK